MSDIYGKYSLTECAKTLNVTPAFINRIQRETGIGGKVGIKGSPTSFTQQEIDALAEKSGLRESYIANIDSLMGHSNGLFDRLAASYVAASQIGIDLVSSQVISNLNGGMSATVYGVVFSELEINTYTRKTGKEGKMLTFVLADSTGRINVVIWDEKIIDELQERGIRKDSKIKIANGIVKENAYGRQISPGKWGAIILEPEDFPALEVKQERTDKVIPIEDITEFKDGTLFIRAHGIPPQQRRLLKESGRRFVDATCPRVARVQSIIRYHTNKGCEAIIVGDVDHP